MEHAEITVIDDNLIDEDTAQRLKELLSEDEPVRTYVDPDWVDPKDIRAEDNSKWSDVSNRHHYPDVILDLLTRSVLLPRADFQLPIAATYLMAPSVFCNRIPILVSQGGSGTGKSTLAHLACGIHSSEPLGAGSTFPSIRNQIRNSRFYDPDSGSRGTKNEKNCCLAWEDINSASLRAFDGNIFNLLKLGVDRKGKISIANMGGSNSEFEVFSPKLISSIHPFYAEHDFREIIRRIIVIEHKKYNLFSTGDHSSAQEDLSPDDLIDLGELDWSGCKSAFDTFWLSKHNANEFARVKRSITKSKSVKFPSAYFQISKDLIATGVVCGFFSSVTNAVVHFSEYFEWHQLRIESQATGAEMLMRSFIEQKQKLYEATYERAVASGTQEYLDPLRLDPKEIKEFLENKSRDGELDINATPRERNYVMESLGWRLKTESGSSTNYWYPATE